MVVRRLWFEVVSCGPIPQSSLAAWIEEEWSNSLLKVCIVEIVEPPCPVVGYLSIVGYAGRIRMPCRYLPIISCRRLRLRLRIEWQP